MDAEKAKLDAEELTRMQKIKCAQNVLAENPQIQSAPFV